MHQEHTFLISHWTKQQFPVFDVQLDHKPSQRLNVPWCVQFLFKSFGFNAGVVKWKFSFHVLFKYLNTFLARAKSASVGDASLYDKHFAANIKSGLHSSNVLQFSDNCSEQ